MASNGPATAGDKAPWVIHPVLFAVHPVLFLYAHNISEVAPGAVTVPAAVLVAAALAVWAPLRLALRSWARSGLVLSYLLVAFFSYRHIYDTIAPSRIKFVSLPIVAMLSGGMLVGLAYLVFVCIRSIRAGNNLPIVTRIVNVVGIALLLVPGGRIAVHLLDTDARNRRKANLSTLKQPVAARPGSGPLPNIFYVILDAYGRADMLRALYGFDNSRFIGELRRRGFYVADKSRSNYYMTSQSVASSMNFQHLPPSFQDQMASGTTGADGLLVAFLREQGYAIAAFSSGIADTELVGADLYLTPHWSLDEFQSKLLSTTPLGLADEGLGVFDQYAMHRRRILYTLAHLADACRTDRPTFVFAHVLCPHPPFVFGPDGGRPTRRLSFDYSDADHLVRDDGSGITRKEYASLYVDQVRFLNGRVLTAVDEILAASDRPPVIILQADHGPRSMLKWGRLANSCVTECLSILNAYHVPGGKPPGLHPRITPVNTFRVLLNHIFGTKYEPLPDRSYFSAGKLIDVTEMMDREEWTILGAPASRAAGDRNAP